ncbi:hypothetical protein C7U60_14240 [Mesorhizobium plurifarium]|uniref:hypothetical protein n=1 Tax=Sinorhizobium arboris TaxID=76745 RepID=UPI0003FF78DA|nr:hypothetical protein [Sinorhizobium arboris]PST22368.1 hypothetical protein C7U60_14240 [Mesorhizobium plurifarium]
MHDERPDQMTMIGLHKLASQFGDGLVPELYELLTRRARMLEESPNVTEFPAWQARPPARDPLGLAPASEGTVLPFPARGEPPVQEKKIRES